MTAFREMMRGRKERVGSGVVLALDVGGPYEERLKRAEGVLAATKEGIAGVKLNFHLLLPYGLTGLQAIRNTCEAEGIPLIADLKLNDIESTNLEAVETLSHFGVDGVIMNPFVGREEGLGSAIERVHQLQGGALLLVYMSHKGADEGYGLKTAGGEPLYRAFAKKAKQWGADGIVVSGRSPGKIAESREIVGDECLIFSPGIGAQGGELSKAAESGADFFIVGRAITESSDPRRSLHAFRQSQASFRGPKR